ncbi:MAG: DUF192 domain-containing protein [Patescibacteria group bacterium]
MFSTKNIKLGIGLGLILGLIVGYRSLNSITPLNLNGHKITVETATTPAARERGLSGRDQLAIGGGMLFVFPALEQPAFWMKDMNFPLDIIWLNDNWQIVHITPNLSPASYPNTVSPPTPIKYVLEINAGLIERFGLKVGDKIKK